MNDDIATISIAEMMDRYLSNEDDSRVMLRARWIHEVMQQLIAMRDELGLTQTALGERMGKQQSAIARLERGDDIKLSTLFDYLIALGQAPTGPIITVPVEEAVARLRASARAQSEPAIATNRRSSAELAAD